MLSFLKNNFKKYIRRFLRISLFACGAFIVLIFVTNLTIYIASKSYIYEDVADLPDARAVLIPGAAIFSNGSLSPIFLNLADKAIELYEENKVVKILLYGENSTDSHNEVNPVRLYLLGKGIPDQDIFLDHAGFDTYSSMYRARDIFGVSSVIIATQSFHLPRA